MLPFWISIASLSVCQGAVVALPRVWSPAWFERARSRAWALLPPLSVIVFVLVGRIAEHASADALTYIALVGVPLGAVLALGWLVRGARPALALLVAPLFALAWADRGGLAGEAAALALTALSCAALGTLIGAVTPARWLALGIVAMACADAALVISDLLQAPNNALNAARPAAGLPQLQAELFGSAAMGYGDLFVAGLLGGLLAAAGRRRWQDTGALLAMLLALVFDLLFFAVSELPATVPIAVALAVVVALGRRGGVNLLGGRFRPGATAASSRLPSSAAPASARIRR